MRNYIFVTQRNVFKHVKGKNLLKGCTFVRTLATASQELPLSGTDVQTQTDYHDGPLRVYQEKVASGQLQHDAHQESVVEELQALHERLKSYEHPKKQKSFWFWQSEKKSEFKGLYLYGSVGTGKTMLMDLFHNTSGIINKNRVHFHKFMLDVHDRIHQVKLNQPKIKTTRDSKPFDAIGPVAEQISEESTLLCFDEFQVTDVADALIVKKLFTGLFENGVIVVSTSNRHPDDLYKNGLQRRTFLPFIDVLKRYCDVVSLDSGVDYRKLSLPSEGTVYFKGSGQETMQAMDRVVEELNVTSEPLMERTMNIKRREVVFPVTYGRILDSSFDSLCKKNMGAIDYLEISREFDVLVLRNVPRMNLNSRTEARRFITLIDTLYDNRVKLVMNAETEVETIFDRDQPMDSNQEMQLMDDLGISDRSDGSKASLFTGEEELFAFDRVISRLKEMQSKDYWEWGRSNQRTRVGNS